MTHDTEETCQPKHLKQYNNSWSHCCFAGCTPMGCPGGCCIMEMGHRADCPADPFRQAAEELHDLYVNNGMRKHLFDPHTVIPVPRPARQTKWCDCDDVARYGNRCGPSGCQNRPA